MIYSIQWCHVRDADLTTSSGTLVSKWITQPNSTNNITNIQIESTEVLGFSRPNGNGSWRETSISITLPPLNTSHFFLPFTFNLNGVRSIRGMGSQLVVQRWTRTGDDGLKSRCTRLDFAFLRKIKPLQLTGSGNGVVWNSKVRSSAIWSRQLSLRILSLELGCMRLDFTDKDQLIMIFLLFNVSISFYYFLV